MYEFEIYQMDPSSNHCFRELPELLINNNTGKELINKDQLKYNKVYQSELPNKPNNVSKDEGDKIILEELFRKFNINHPDDYKGRSLSISDIIKLKDRYYICQRVGWKKIGD
jgi:predicted metal-dependent peptidase